MSYIGNTPTQQNFVAGADQFSGNGSTVAFTLSRSVNTVFDIFVTVSNVPQDPFTAYTVAGNTLTFDSAPPSGTNNIDVVYRATNVQTFVPTPGVSTQLGLGSASAPSLTFIGDTNTGIFSPAADTIAFTEGGVESMRIDSNRNVLVGTTSASTPSTTGFISTANTFGFKNRIINGAMVIDQRNAGASVTPTTAAQAFAVDRTSIIVSQNSKLTAQQNAGSVTPPAGFTNYLGTTSSSAYAVLTGDYFFISQAIEGFNVADFGWGSANAQTITISFWVRSSLTGTHSGSLRNNAINRAYVFTFTISSANTWEQKSITIPGDTSGTWLTNNSVGIYLGFNLGSGSTFSTTAGSWTAGNFVGATGAVSVVGTNSATFYITGVQLEKGSTATSFDYRPYSTELQLAQRYYERIDNVLASCTNGGLANSYASYLKFTVTKRATPVVTIYSSANLGGTAGSATWYPPNTGTVAAITTEATTTDTYMFSRAATSTYTLVAYSAVISSEL